MQNELKIRQIPLNKLKPYKNNAKIHTEKQINQIIASIKEFGFNDPIACDEKGVIIEGHGRYEAAKKMKMQTIPTIVLKGLTSEQKKAYILAHNKLTMDTGFDIEILSKELNTIADSGLDMSSFGFDIIGDIDINEMFEEVEQEKESQTKTENKSYEIVVICNSEEQMKKRMKQLEHNGWEFRKSVK